MHSVTATICTIRYVGHAVTPQVYGQMGVIRAKFYLSSGNEAKAICEWDSLCPTS